MKELCVNLNLNVDIVEYLCLNDATLNISKSNLMDDISIQVVKPKQKG